MKRSKYKGSITATIVLFSISSVAISVLGWRQVIRWTTDPAWVASADISAGQKITQDLLRLGRSSDSEIAVKEPRALLGRTLSVSKQEGDVFKASDLSSQPRRWLAQKIPEGKVLYTLIPQSTTIPYSQIRMGDHLDVLAKGGRGVRTVAQNVMLLGSITPPSGSQEASSGRGLLSQLASSNKSQQGGARTGAPLILAVAPEDVYPLAGIGANEEVTLVLHGEQETRNGKYLQVRPAPSKRRVEVYKGNQQEKIIISR